MADIILSTLNARYNHASLGLRYLHANLAHWKSQCLIMEFTIKGRASEIAQEILGQQPKIVGLGIYIWNCEQTLEVVKLLKQARPDLIVVGGGPEISFESETQELFTVLDFVFKGEADFSFREFVSAFLLRGELPKSKIIVAGLPDIKEIVLPYDEYTAEDLALRTIYVEASRGCPYKCEYCLSALDVSVRNFPIDLFLEQMGRLLQRGARQFKFVDRTFNLAISTSTKILEFFLSHIDKGLFLHFELVPDRLPDELKALIEKFPPGSLQFEIGVQTWNPSVARNVSRRQNYEKISDNLKYLRERTGVHTHADLIVGLPGEDFASFAFGFNALYALAPDEIQVGILKRLKGTPIVRHDQEFAVVWHKKPPFQILENKDLSATQLQELKVFADFWDLVANSGRFPHVREWADASGETPFDFFFKLAHHLYRHFGRTHSIHLVDLERAVAKYLGYAPAQRVSGHLAIAPTIPPAYPRRQARHLEKNRQ